MLRIRSLVAVVVACLVLVGCSSGGSWKPVDNWPPKSAMHPVASQYTVKAGDTLYSIAWRYGLDFRELARLNNIGPPFTIRVGQVLKLAATPPAPTPSSRRGSSGSGYAYIGGAAQSANAAKNRPAYTAMKSATSPSRTDSRKSFPSFNGSSAPVAWLWPADGKILGRFSDGVRVNKGIDIGGKLGDSVRSTRNGVVVYAGNGLAGYGNLIIIKHDEIYLSAYAHNKAILVKEGQTVKAGDKIAEIGSSGAAYPKLHFEIRRDGKPVNPMQLLPRR